ncbi:MAG: hypothetical protein ACJ751_20790 [Niastella sp.]|jgi:hypothetical protein|uniref:hypothetical protein n=1 Tax=Niastella sp. TaxID=1869183 RepID=UPI00389AF06D
MKNTLLAVLAISLYSDSQAQNVVPHSTRYIKYQEAIPNQSIDKGAKKVNHKLATDNSAFTKMADGTASSDKLADILLNSLENFDSVSRTGKPELRVVPAGLHTYAGYIQQWTINRPVSKPRPLTKKKSGWLL